MPEKNPLESKRQSGAAPRTFMSKVVLASKAVVIGMVVSFVITIIRVLRDPQFNAFILGLDQLQLPLMAAGVALVVIAGLIIWRRPKLRTVFISAVLLVGVCLGLNSLVRIDSYYGGMFPRFAWRWIPTAEKRFADYQSNQQQGNSEHSIQLSLLAVEHDFTNFLGANRDGIIGGINLETDWSVHRPRELWRHPVGLGWGGFAIYGQAAITQEQRGSDESVVCYELKSGREMWVHKFPVRFTDEHGDGPRANPVVVAGRVYTMGATGLLTCLNGSDGKLIWQQQTLSDPESQNLLWGMSGSPLVVNDLVIVTPGGGPGRSLVAYAAEDGRQIFSGGDDAAAYSSPIFVELAGEKQYLNFNGEGLRAFDETGNPLWLHPWLTQGELQRVNVAQPIVVDDFGPDENNSGHVLISSGYGMGTALLRISREHAGWHVEEVWRSQQLRSKMSNFVVHDQFIYGLDNGILTCLDVQNGQRKWKRGRYGHGQMLLVGEQLLIQTESGEVALVSANPQSHKELGRFQALSDKTWNNAALAGNILIVRNDREAAAFELPIHQDSDTSPGKIVSD